MIGQHFTEAFWGRSVPRYCIADLIVKKNNWDEFYNFLSEVKLGSDKIFVDLIWGEYKIFNYEIIITHALCTILFGLQKKNLLESGAKEKILSYIKKRNKKAKKILENSKKNDDKFIYTPHILLYLAGMSLSNFLYILDKQTKSFNKKKDLLKKLKEFKDHRNVITHNICSNRIYVEETINEGVKSGAEVKSLLDEIIKNLDIKYDDLIKIEYEQHQSPSALTP